MRFIEKFMLNENKLCIVTKLPSTDKVLLTPEDEDNLNTIIIQKSMERGVRPIPISRYVRNIIVEHIVEETSAEKQLGIYNKLIR